MLNVRRKIVNVNSNTQLICALLGATGCSCNCPSCQGCTDCTDCPSLTINDITMKIYRKGTNFVCGGSAPTGQQFPKCAPPYPPCATAFSPNADPPVTYFVQYNAYTLTGITVCFYIDDLLTGACSGRYVGDIFVSGNQCGSIEMGVGDKCTVFEPYTVSTGGGIDTDLQPSP